MAQIIAAGITGGASPAPMMGGGKPGETEALGGSEEPVHTQKARQRVAESTSPT